MISRRVRDLGVYAEVKPSETHAVALEDRRGIIISGGPASVYDPGSPAIDPEILQLGIPVLGICYGLQIMAHTLGGKVSKGELGEYGLAKLEVVEPEDRLFASYPQSAAVWMSHRDLVAEVPEDFVVTARTATCPVAGMANDWRKQYGIQFHPEVVHTERGQQLLSNFLFSICGCEQDWQPAQQLEELEAEIRRTARGRNVFFFTSGGVDSTVAFALTLRALGAERVHAAYVDTGLMRAGETEFVREVFERLAGKSFEVVDARAEFLNKLTGVVEPEAKRKIIGEEFVAVQERVLASGDFLDGAWILGQGTIYPDTIESGGTAKADLIKTHHNRVEGIQKLLESGRVVEPIAQLYKDEVRRVGSALGLPAELLDRHPFPGPGLAIRCLGATEAKPVAALGEGFLLPVSSVGVQGDSRTYRQAMALPAYQADAFEQATKLTNELREINRVVALVGSHAGLAAMASFVSGIDAVRLERLRQADAIVRRISEESGFEEKVWQFPVVLLPVGVAGRPDSVVLRPIDSVDGMTAKAVPMPEIILEQMKNELLAVEGLCAVFYDLTHKPPGTIEWE